MTRHAFICDAVRTPFGRYGGVLSSGPADLGVGQGIAVGLERD